MVAEEMQKPRSEKGELADRQDRIDKGRVSFVDFSPKPMENPLNDAFLIRRPHHAERSCYMKKDLMKDFNLLLMDFFRTIGADKPDARKVGG